MARSALQDGMSATTEVDPNRTPPYNLKHSNSRDEYASTEPIDASSRHIRAAPEIQR